MFLFDLRYGWRIDRARLAGRPLSRDRLDHRIIRKKVLRCMYMRAVVYPERKLARLLVLNSVPRYLSHPDVRTSVDNKCSHALVNYNFTEKDATRPEFRVKPQWIIFFRSGYRGILEAGRNLGGLCEGLWPAICVRLGVFLKYR